MTSVTPKDLPINKLADPDWVDRASDDDFERVLSIAVDSEYRLPMEVLATPERIQRSKAALVALKFEHQQVLSELRSERASFQQVCWSQGLAGKKRWHAFEAEWKSRHAIATARNSRLERAFIQFKGQVRQEAGGLDKRRQNEVREALIRLAKAVAAHKESMEFAGEEGTVNDRALWAELSNIRIPHGRLSTVSLRELLDKLLAGGAW